MSPLVSASDLRVLLDRGEAVVADVRWYLDGRRGLDAYRAGHIPGAVFVDLDSVLAAPPSQPGGRHPLPAADAFADAMAGLGISDDDLVVAYDDAGGATAARLWWMLDATGHRGAVLDGGIQAWAGALETGAPPRRERGSFTARPWPDDRLADADAVTRMIDAGRATLLDARDGARYRGETEPIDPRAGHIPGATSAPFSGNLGSDRTFLSAAELRARYGALGVDDAEPREVIAYCGSGVTACHTILALRVAGIADARLYAGSWSDWCSDPSRPVAVGDDA